MVGDVDDLGVAELGAEGDALADALGSLTFEGDPLRSYLMFAPVQEAQNLGPATMVISLYGDDHVELRVFRGTDLFGVFYLDRDEP
mgnify:CR=1 FL=1